MMDTLYGLLIAPFAEFGFMQRALAGSLMLSLGACPVGVFLMLRRMSLSGDAMAHAILPGAAAGFLFYGLEILPMTIGGLIAGIIVALGAGAVSRFTIQREDASMAAFYLISLAIGVLMVSIRGSSVDLMHVLFGTVLALNNEALTLIGGIVRSRWSASPSSGGRSSPNVSTRCSCVRSAGWAARCISSSSASSCSTWSAASRRSARCYRSG